MKNKLKIITGFSLLHIIADFCSVYFVLFYIVPRSYTNDFYFYTIVLYNLCAFLLQLPIGVLADIIKKNIYISLTGFILILIAYLTKSHNLYGAILVGLGNAAFHVGGGLTSLEIGERKATLAGIFVSTGAFGLWIANTLSNNQKSVSILPIALIILSICILFFKLRIWIDEENLESIQNINSLEKSNNYRIDALITIFLFLTICLRGYLGSAMKFPYLSNLNLSIIFSLSIVFGKALGGILGDRFGYLKCALISLILSSILFAFSYTSSTAGIIGVCLFNMTMPITLTVIANIFKNNMGFAFGLTTTALFIGFMFTIDFMIDIKLYKYLLSFGSIISAIFIGSGIFLYNKYKKMSNNND